MTQTLIEKLHEFHKDLMSNGLDECATELYEIIEEYKATEQVPVGWQFLQDGYWHIGGNDLHKRNTIEYGYEVRELFTHPQLSDETVKDAARYRWLSDNAKKDSDKSMVMIYTDKTKNFVEPLNCLDEVIDEAMKADK